jgi:hypothetical protein
VTKTIVRSALFAGIACLLTMAFTGCNKTDDTNLKHKATRTMGLWLSQLQADELRLTGRLSEQCSSIKAQSKIASRDSLKIDEFGAIYIYNPVFAMTATPEMIEKTKLGILNDKGDVLLTSYDINDDLSGAIVSLSNDDQRLSVKYLMKSGEPSLQTYVRSNDDELASRSTETARCLTSK